MKDENGNDLARDNSVLKNHLLSADKISELQFIF